MAYDGTILSTSGLVGYWRLGESAGPTAVDAFSTNDGTYSGTGITYGVAGAIVGDADDSITFGGVAVLGKVELPATAFLTADSSVTVEFWNKVATGDGGGNAFTIGKADDPDRCQAHVPYSDNTLYWDYGSTGVGGRVSCSYAGYYDRWVHVALTFDATSNVHAIYLDGVLKASTTNANSPTATLTGGQIGAWSISGYHKGSLDEFALYNVALTPEQIHAHYVIGLALWTPTVFLNDPDRLAGAVALDDPAVAAGGGGPTTHFGAFAVPLTLSVATAGSRTRFGSFAVPLSLSVATAGTRTRFGLLAVPLSVNIFTAGTVTSGAATHFGAFAVPLSLSIATAGSHTAIGRTIGLGLTLNVATNGTRTAFSTLTLPLSLTIATAGARASFGSFSLPLTVSVATNGTHTGIGSSSLALSLDVATTGFVGAFSTLDVPLVLSIGTRGFIEGAIEEESSRRLRVDKEKLEKEPWPPVPPAIATKFTPYKPGYMTKKEP